MLNKRIIHYVINSYKFIKFLLYYFHLCITFLASILYMRCRHLILTLIFWLHISVLDSFSSIFSTSSLVTSSLYFLHLSIRMRSFSALVDLLSFVLQQSFSIALGGVNVTFSYSLLIGLNFVFCPGFFSLLLKLKRKF